MRRRKGEARDAPEALLSTLSGVRLEKVRKAGRGSGRWAVSTFSPVQSKWAGSAQPHGRGIAGG